MSSEGSRLFDETLIARRRLRRWAAVAVAGLVVVRLLAEVVPVMRVPDLALLDGWQSLRGTARPSSQVVIVAIDEKSIQRFGPPAWPRSEYVPLVDRLAGAGAKATSSRTWATPPRPGLRPPPSCGRTRWRGSTRRPFPRLPD